MIRAFVLEMRHPIERYNEDAWYNSKLSRERGIGNNDIILKIYNVSYLKHDRKLEEHITKNCTYCYKSSSFIKNEGWVFEVINYGIYD